MRFFFSKFVATVAKFFGLSIKYTEHKLCENGKLRQEIQLQS